MKTIADLMVVNVMTLQETDSLADAKALMNDRNIRNVPILNENNEFVGLLSQKEYLRHAFHLVSQFGTQQLSKKERQTPISNAMAKDIITLSPTTKLSTAADFFIENKYGCLPVTSDNKLVGILTPIDFVKFANKMLNEA